MAGAWRWLVRAGNGVLAVVFAVATVYAFAMVFVSWHRNQAPVRWGQFTEQSTTCHDYLRGRSCTSIGSWVSDSGDQRFDHVELDDGVARGANVPAGYREDDLAGGTAPTQVHTKGNIDASPWGWLSGAFFAGAAACGFALGARRTARISDETATTG